MHMRNAVSGLLTMTGVAFGMAGPARAAAFIVQDGAPKAQIVIAEQPTRMQKVAAEELQKYVRKISGAELPIMTAPTDTQAIKLYVGQSASTDKLGLKNEDLEHGAYRMKSGPDYLVLLGKDTNYFQDEPSSAGEVYPTSRADRKRAAEAWEKQNGDRWGTPFMSSFKGYHAKLGLWANDEHGSLNAVNDFLRSLGVEWYMPGDFGEILPEMTSIQIPDVDRTVRPEVATRSMGFYYNAPFMASEDEFLWQLRLGFNPNGDIGGHGIANMLATAKVKQEHPEYFALYGGERETESRGGKPCYSSEGLLASSLAYARLMFDDYDWDVVSLMPTDGYTYFCQCDLCKGKDTPERGYNGMMSDYVWDFINRAAAASAKTHPDRRISNNAYSSYLLPPEKIETFHPNVVMGICQHRSHFGDPAKKQQYRDIREAYLKKLPGGKISIWEYYLDARSGVPVYFTQNIIDDIRNLKGRVDGEGIEVFRSFSSGSDPKPDPALAANHLNCWLTARLWWNPDQDANALLAKYYQDFYGPAAGPMQAFIEFCEQNWPIMRSKYQAIDQAFTLLADAQNAAGHDSLYAQRIQLLADLMQPLHELRDRLEIGRKNNPVATFATRTTAPALDGKFDETFWKNVPSYTLKDLKTGGDVANPTSFQVALADNSLYFALRCEDNDMANVNIPSPKNGDHLIFSGDVVEIEVETPAHSYYQIAIDPAGHVTSLDRKGGFNKWDSGIEVVTARDDRGWNIEARLPFLGATQEELNPEFGVAGDQPTADAPWHFNICRVWKREKIMETSAFSPTESGGFHDVMKFGKLTPE